MKGNRGEKPQTFICARDGCNEKFIKRAHNQRFCSGLCCQKETNKKLLEKYYANKKPLRKNRKCRKRGCTTFLSKYNKGSICGTCKIKDEAKTLNRHAKIT